MQEVGGNGEKGGSPGQEGTRSWATMPEFGRLGPEIEDMTVYGTAGDDMFEAIIGSPIALTLDGARSRLLQPGEILREGSTPTRAPATPRT